MPCADKDLKDAPRFGRSVEADDQIIKTLVEANRRITTRKIATNLHDLIKLFFFIKKKKKWSFIFAQETKSLSKQSTIFPITRYFSNLCDVRIFKTRDN